MLPDSVIRRLGALGEVSRSGKRVDGLFRLLESPVLWMEAYANIYANKGAITRGMTQNTLDGFTDERVVNLQTLLKENRYRPRPVRRIYIPKSDGRQRPLGTSTGDDKLVQEVVRLILERLYEPIFSDASHGFRPNRSPHTALSEIQHQWTGVKWFVNVDITGFYDNVDHQVLLNLLSQKIDDKRFINLIRLMLKAGYMEDWKFRTTYSGTPQGGIASPILANIYLHELDKFMEEEAAEFGKGKRRAPNVAYRRLTNRIYTLRKKIDLAKEKGNLTQANEMLSEIKPLDHQRKSMSSSNPWDPNYRRLLYCRYADDVAIGVIGTKEEARGVMEKVGDYLKSSLRLDISPEKSGITHARVGMIYLGYTVRTYSRPKTVRTKRAHTRYTTQKAIRERVLLGIPREKITGFMRKHGYLRNGKASHRPPWLWRSDAEIILGYNAEMRGFANYYGLVHNAPRVLRKLYWEWQRSLLKTLAAKHRTSVKKVVKKLKQGNRLLIQEAGMKRPIEVFKLTDMKRTKSNYGQVDRVPSVLFLKATRTELVSRLMANECEYCGTKEGYFEVHHVKKLKGLKTDDVWKQVMVAMRRKTLVLCVECHHQLHAGKLPSWKRRTAA
jgi:group II intron reverse transcriptase/maturase